MSTKFPPIIVKNREFNFGRVSVIVPEMVITCVDEAQIEALRGLSDLGPEIRRGVQYELKGGYPKLGVDGQYAEMGLEKHQKFVLQSVRFHWALWHEVIIPTWGLSEEAYNVRLWPQGIPKDSEIGKCSEEMAEVMKKTVRLLKVLDMFEKDMRHH